MPQQAQVPKFGDWENQDDVPYTVYFEKAKKSRKSKMNPQISDPLQAPEEAQIKYGESEPEGPKAVQASPNAKLETRVSREEQVDLRKSTDSSSQQPRRVSRPSGGSVQSFDNSPIHPRHHPRGVNRASVSSESSYGAGSSTPTRTKLGQLTRGDENGDDVPVIPKFGDWDDNDPASAEGYTELFNKARQDKHGGGKSPMITSEDNKFYGQRNKKSKGFGCFSWMRK